MPAPARRPGLGEEAVGFFAVFELAGQVEHQSLAKGAEHVIEAIHRATGTGAEASDEEAEMPCLHPSAPSAPRCRRRDARHGTPPAEAGPDVPATRELALAGGGQARAAQLDGTGNGVPSGGQTVPTGGRAPVVM
jgi:hypothetical protein